MYRVHFWISDYAIDLQARDQVRSNIWYSFRRHDIEIPYPMQVQFDREEQPLRTDAAFTDAASRLSAIARASSSMPMAPRTLLRRIQRFLRLP